MNLSPVESVARFVVALCKPGTPDLDAIAATARENAATMRAYAEKARAAKTGKYRGYTVAAALSLAAEHEARAVTVPAAIRALLGEPA